MNTTTPTGQQSAPQLDVPGAGLPKVELLIARTMFRVQRMLKGRDDWTALFAEERAEILRLTRSVSDDACSKPILVDRIRGMEDSSRYWSVYMVLDHLNIVNGVFTTAIVMLLRGKIPDRKGGTAEVKPNPGSDISTIAAFEKTCDTFQGKTDKPDSLHSSVRYDHPWFGPLDAASWHALAGFHMRLHRKQIERIISAM